MYLIRIAPCTDSPELSLYMMAYNVSQSLRIWTLTLMMTGGVRHCCLWDGAGLVSAVSLAPSACKASAASTAELTSSLLPTRLRDVVDSGVATAVSAWIMLASCPSTLSTAVIYCYQWLTALYQTGAACAQWKSGEDKNQQLHPQNDKLACF
jgi:hypothetical protein